MATGTVEVVPIMDDVMAALPGGLSGKALEEAFTKTYVDIARQRYPTKNVVVFDKDALASRDFDDFQEQKTIDAGNGESIRYSCLIFASGSLEYFGTIDLAHLRYDGSFEEKDASHITFFEIPSESTTTS